MAITGFAESSRHLWVAKVSNDATLAVTSGVSENRTYLKKKQTNNKQIDEKYLPRFAGVTDIASSIVGSHASVGERVLHQRACAFRASACASFSRIADESGLAELAKVTVGIVFTVKTDASFRVTFRRMPIADARSRIADQLNVIGRIQVVSVLLPEVALRRVLARKSGVFGRTAAALLHANSQSCRNPSCILRHGHIQGDFADADRVVSGRMVVRAPHIDGLEILQGDHQLFPCHSELRRFSRSPLRFV